MRTAPTPGQTLPLACPSANTRSWRETSRRLRRSSKRARATEKENAQIQRAPSLPALKVNDLPIFMEALAMDAKVLETIAIATMVTMSLATMQAEHAIVHHYL